ncbi:uncharacterized protein [Euphorbia lathyris]|uniref:uncharacterized protein n=1 Tax=Euphorbia lathyris TaxID=212925 RepID=UPI0033143233
MKSQYGSHVNVVMQNHLEKQHAEFGNIHQEEIERKNNGIESSKVSIESRCNIRQFGKLILTFDKDKIDAVKQLGLDGLLKVSSQNLKNQLIADLVHSFDVEKCELCVHGKRLKFTAKDIERTLGLPSKGQDVKQFFGDCNGDILERLNISTKVLSVKQLYNELEVLPSGEEFKAKFFLYALSTIIAPSSSINIHKKYFALLNDLSKIRTMNWAEYTLGFLQDGMLKFNENNSGDGKRRMISGCIFVLQIFYLEHTSVGYSSLSITKQEIPTMQYWNADVVSKVNNKILSLGGVKSEKVKLLYGNDMESCKCNDVIIEIQDLKNQIEVAEKSIKVQLESNLTKSCSQIQITSSESVVEVTPKHMLDVNSILSNQRNDKVVEVESSCENKMKRWEHSPVTEKVDIEPQELEDPTNDICDFIFEQQRVISNKFYKKYNLHWTHFLHFIGKMINIWHN